MILSNVAIGVLLFLVSLELTMSVILLIKAHDLYRRSLEIMSSVYDWLE